MLFCRTEDDSDAKIRKRFVLAKAFSIFLHIRNYTLLYMSIQSLRSAFLVLCPFREKG